MSDKDRIRKAMKERAKNIHWLEQLVAGLENGSRQAEEEARRKLAEITLHGSVDMIVQMFRGVLKQWDSEQEEFDKMLKETK
jgi:hypothetical protein